MLQTPLTQTEKTAGLKFLETEQAKLLASFETDPPSYRPLPWHKIYRHECSSRNNISTAIELKEKYIFSPELEVDGEVIPAQRFGFIFKEGRCRGCGNVARSKTGRFVDAYTRPPLEGRIAR